MTTLYPLNDGHIHEAIDRIDVAINYLQSTLAEHSLINSVNEYEAEVQAAIKILSNLYQRIGSDGQIKEIADKHILKAGYVVMET